MVSLAKLYRRGGTASNFLNEHNLAIGMGFAPAAADLLHFFQRLKEMGRKAAPTYLDLYWVFFRLANRLMVPLGFHVCNLSPKQPVLWKCLNYFMGDWRDMVKEPISLDDIWSYDPFSCCVLLILYSWHFLAYFYNPTCSHCSEEQA